MKQNTACGIFAYDVMQRCTKIGVCGAIHVFLVFGISLPCLSNSNVFFGISPSSWIDLRSLTPEDCKSKLHEAWHLNNLASSVDWFNNSTIELLLLSTHPGRCEPTAMEYINQVILPSGEFVILPLQRSSKSYPATSCF